MITGGVQVSTGGEMIKAISFSVSLLSIVADRSTILKVHFF
jgi:hypothetical protein